MPEDIELTKVKTGMAALLARAAGGILVAGYGCPTADLSTVIAIEKDTDITLYLSDFVVGLTDFKTEFGTYTFTEDGTVTKT